MDIKVLGIGCANCRNTIALIEQVAREKGTTVTVGKVEELREIMGYGVMATPGVVVDGKVVHAGGVPSRAKVEHWLSAEANLRRHGGFDQALPGPRQSCVTPDSPEPDPGVNSTSGLHPFGGSFVIMVWGAICTPAALTEEPPDECRPGPI